VENVKIPASDATGYLTEVSSVLKGYGVISVHLPPGAITLTT
jgi:hypothetical protein